MEIVKRPRTGGNAREHKSSKRLLDDILEEDFVVSSNSKKQRRSDRLRHPKDKMQRKKEQDTQPIATDLVECSNSGKTTNNSDKDTVANSKDTVEHLHEMHSDIEVATSERCRGLLQTNGTDVRDVDTLFVCELCRKDISKFNSVRRQQHINRCCDQSDVEQQKENRKPEPVSCPICRQQLRQERHIASHLKTCGSRHSVHPSELVKIISDVKQCWQKESTLRQERGHKKERPHVERKRTQNLQPKRGMDDDLLLAMALSVSVSDGRERDESRKRKQKKQMRTSLRNVEQIPSLLLRSKEEAEDILSARAGQILIPDFDESQEITPTPAYAVSMISKHMAVMNGEQKNQTQTESGESNVCELETDDQHKEGSVRVKMSDLCTDANTDEQPMVIDYSKKSCTDFWLLASSRLSESTVEQYYVNGLIDIPNHVRKQFECLSCGKYGNLPDKQHQLEDENDKGAQPDPLSPSNEQSQGFVVQSSPMCENHEDKNPVTIQKETQTSNVCLNEELLQDFSSLINSSVLSDVILVARDNCHIHAHQVFLAARSLVFAKMFTDYNDRDADFNGGNDCSSGQIDRPAIRRRAVVCLDNASKDAVMAMLNYIYTGSCTWQEDNTKEMCWLANRFQLTGLQNMCVMRNSLLLSSPLHVFQATTPSHQPTASNRTDAMSEQIANAVSLKGSEAGTTIEYREPEEVVIEPLDAMSPVLQISEPGSVLGKGDNQLQCLPSPQSVQPHEDFLEQAVCESPLVSSPELPSLDNLISGSPLPCLEPTGQTDRDIQSNIRGSGEDLVWDTSFSDCPIHLSGIATPCYVPETPTESINLEDHNTADKKLEATPNSVVWNSPGNKLDCQDDSYPDLDDSFPLCEEVYYNDWISSDNVTENVGQDNHKQSSSPLDEQLSCILDSSQQINQAIHRDDTSKASCSNNPFGESLEDSSVVSMDTENSSVCPANQISTKTKTLTIESEVVNLCDNKNVPNNKVEVIQIPAQHCDLTEVDMCDDDDELFAHCFPGDIVAKAGHKDLQRCNAANQQSVTPCNPRHRKPKQRVTPLPDYDNMPTPMLKKNMGKFGMRHMAKRKMITKLRQVYYYTHPGVETEEQVMDSKHGRKRPTQEVARGAIRSNNNNM